MVCSLPSNGVTVMSQQKNIAMADDCAGFSERAKALRPFYFIVVYWGERFRNYFLNFCLPTMLAPGNIPALLNREKNKFLICTTTEDWRLTQQSPIFELLKSYVDPVFIEIPWPEPNRTGCQHMGIGHKPATQMAYRDKAYGVILTPDFMLSDGSVAALQRHAVAGTQVVLNVALRFGEEPLFENLEQAELVRFYGNYGDRGEVISITGRQLVAAGLKSFHSEVLRYEYEAPYFTDFPCACWWKVPKETGIVIHSFSWAPLLLDYSIVGDHSTDVLETWTMDATYVDQNFGHAERIHIVQDSDEMIQVSWAPLSDRPQPLAPSSLQSWPVIKKLVKGLILRETFLSPVFDSLKRQIFPVTVRWHANDLNENWDRTEKKALGVIRQYINDDEFGIPPERLELFVGAQNRNLAFPGILGLALVFARIRFKLIWSAAVIRRAIIICRNTPPLIYAIMRGLFTHRGRIAAVLKKVIRGDSESTRRMLRRLDIVFCHWIGRKRPND